MTLLMRVAVTQFPLLLLCAWTTAATFASAVCSPETNTFTAKVNFSEGQLGYFEFEECEGVNPILGIRLGETYTFVQQDVSNWYHPLGFAYGADGALDDQDELEPGVPSPSSNTACAETLSCPSPQYMLNGELLGVERTEDFGLDAYEPQFFYPLLDWMDRGSFSIELTFDDAAVDQDLFYFCHIHQFMSGRIKVLSPQTMDPLVRFDVPIIPYGYDVPGEFDRTCNTFGLDAWQLPNDFCPNRFVCNTNDASSVEHAQFADCLESMNCRMLNKMTTNVGINEIALFNYHMIPHHENAVNMAKALLPKLPCDDLSNEEDPNCVMQVLVREVINAQNHQIQTMRAVTASLGAPSQDNCYVPLRSIDCDDAHLCFPDARTGTPRYRMNRLTFGSYCMAACVPEQQVQARVLAGWQCGACEE